MTRTKTGIQLDIQKKAGTHSLFLVLIIHVEHLNNRIKITKRKNLTPKRIKIKLKVNTHGL